MRFVDNMVGLVRPLPRWSEARQRRSIEREHSCRVVNLADGADDNAALKWVRPRDTVAVYLLHILADRSSFGIHPRSSLFWWVEHLSRRKAIIVETATGRRADLSKISDYPMLFEMMAEAVETITRGTVGRRAQQLAQGNGALSDGTPKHDPTLNRADVEAIHYAPRDKRLTGKAYEDAIKRLGWSRAVAYRELGPRDGRG